MKNKYKVILIVIISIFLTACQTVSVNNATKSVQMQNKTKSSTDYPGLNIQSTIVENVAYQYSIHVPYLNKKMWDQEMQLWTSNTVTNFIHEAKTHLTPDKIGPHELHIDFEIFSYTAEVLSVKFNKTEHLRGTTPKQSKIIYNFDRQSNKFLSISDLFKKDSNYLVRLSQLTYEKLMEDQDFKKSAKEKTIRKGLEPKVDHFNHFLIKDNKLIILLTPEQTGDQSGKERQIAIDESELSDILLNKYVKSTTNKDRNVQASVTKKVSSKKKAVLDPKKKHVALTFDDGPHPTVTPRILDILAKHHAHATFFVLGNRAEFYPNLLQRAVLEGHEIGSHSWSHPQLTKLKPKQIESQLDKTDEQIKMATGKPAGLVRPPYGALNDTVKSIAGRPIINWSVDTEDWKSRNANKIIAQVKRQVSDGSIILMHDIYPTTAQSLDKVLDWLNKEGYQVVTVSDLLGFTNNPESIEAGKVYSFKIK